MSQWGHQHQRVEEQQRLADCIECGCRSDARWVEWRAYRVDDPEMGEPPALAFYCPACAEAEFGPDE